MPTFCFISRMRFSTEGSQADGKCLFSSLGLHVPSLGSYLNGKVSSDELRSVAKKIGHHWRHVGGALGPDPKFTFIELDDFEAKGRDRDRAQAMLTTWAEKHHKNATRRMLILALKEESQNALISDVFQCDDPDSVTA